MTIKWHQVELMDQVSAYDECWLVESDCGQFEATGIYSCGDLVDIEDIERKNY